MRRYEERAVQSGGRREVRISVPDQIAQTTSAPVTAPRLLPLPPATSMTQTKKVTSIGSLAAGDRNLKWCADKAPATPISAQPIT